MECGNSFAAFAFHFVSAPGFTHPTETSADPDFKIDLLVAIALLRQDRAFQFLIGLIGEDETAGREAIAALATYRSNPSICQQVEAALKRCNNPNLERVFRDQFGRP